MNLIFWVWIVLKMAFYLKKTLLYYCLKQNEKSLIEPIIPQTPLIVLLHYNYIKNRKILMIYSFADEMVWDMLLSFMAFEMCR